MPGRDRSIRIRSGCSARAFSIASRPSRAVSALNPLNSRYSRYISRASSKSSTMRISGLAAGSVMLGVLRLTGALANETTNGGLQIFGRTRLGQHRIASGATRSFRIGRERRVAGDGEHGNIPRARVLFETTSQFETVDPGNVEIRHHDRRAGIECPFECLQSVVSLIDTKPGIRQPVGVHSPAIPIVFDKQHNRSCLRRGHWLSPGPVYVRWSGRPMIPTAELGNPQHLAGLDEIRITQLVAIRFKDLDVVVRVPKMLFGDFAERIASLHRVSLAGSRGRRPARGGGGTAGRRAAAGHVNLSDHIVSPLRDRLDRIPDFVLFLF